MKIYKKNYKIIENNKNHLILKKKVLMNQNNPN